MYSEPLGDYYNTTSGLSKAVLYSICLFLNATYQLCDGGRNQNVARAECSMVCGSSDQSLVDSSAISYSSQCSKTGITNSVVCTIRSGVMLIKGPLLLIENNSP